MYVYLPSSKRNNFKKKQFCFWDMKKFPQGAWKFLKYISYSKFLQSKILKSRIPSLSLCYSVSQSKFLLSALSTCREIDVSFYKIMVKIKIFRTQKIKNLKIKRSYWVSRTITNDRFYLDSLILKIWCSKYIERGIKPERDNHNTYTGIY